jgi:aminoglycoside phosphotransferase (APT) family kinase protein
LSGRVEIELAERIGSTLARYVVATRHTDLPAIDDPQRFRDLRVAPYFEAVAGRRPELAEQLYGVILEVTSRHDVLVHGDFSPKNILTDGQEFWITDFEVAHVGDAEFDTAFLASHLILKSIAFPPDAPLLRTALVEFVGGYLRGTGASPGSAHLGRVIAALLAARIDGRSTVEYLETHQRDEVRILAKQWLSEPIGFWSFLEGKHS